MQRQPHTSRAAFTMVEMIAVVGIIAILVALLVPAVYHFRIISKIGATKTTMASIKTALDAYQADFREYPPSKPTPPIQNASYFGAVDAGSAPPPPFDLTNFPPAAPPSKVMQGGEMLAQALTGAWNETHQTVTGGLPASVDVPGDGQTGFGFKVRGRSYGPYFEAKVEGSIRPRWDQDGNKAVLNESWDTENVVESDPTKMVDILPAPGRHVLSMQYSRYGRAWLYFRRQTAQEVGTVQTGSNLGLAGSVFSNDANAQFTMQHNLDLVGGYNIFAQLQSMSAADQTAEATSMRAAQYLLWHAGPDEAYGTADDVYEAAGSLK